MATVVFVDSTSESGEGEADDDKEGKFKGSGDVVLEVVGEDEGEVKGDEEEELKEAVKGVEKV
jgi:hypothetical protein